MCCLGAVVYSQINGFSFMLLPVAEDTDHEIVHAVRAINPANQRRPSLFDCANGGAVAIDRDIHKNAGLIVCACLLHQYNLAGQCRLAGVSCLFHGAPPDRFGIHVVTEGSQVTVAEGFKVDDGRVNCTLAGRFYGIVGKALATNLGNMVSQLIRRDDLSKPDPLHAGNTLLCLQVLDIGLPFLALNRNGCCKKGAAAVKNQRISTQALLDFEGDLITGKNELPHCRFFNALLDQKAGKNGHQQAED